MRTGTYRQDGALSVTPVMSIYGTDMICYGLGLADYIERDFLKAMSDGDTQDDEPAEDPSWNPRPTVSFWRDYLAQP